ncbi:MAG: AAA family ATPase [Pirellulaceae bacterium]
MSVQRPNNDFVYELLPKGAEQSRLAIERSTYCGAAPVSIQEYNNSVIRQSLRNFRPTLARVQAALSDMVMSKLLVAQVGQAVSSGKSMFLYGAPGNGQSQIAKRIVRAIDPYVWIPRSLSIGGEVMRIFDPSLHNEAPLPENTSLAITEPFDDRWVRVERPFISVGGELNMEHLEASINPLTNIIEAPIHIKSNCGCLAVEDLGRQQVGVEELLNRWIVPMGEGHDFVNLPSGRQIKLPFDQLLVFTTNLAPEDLCDEAFMRRMPYKIEVFDPTETQFRQLFELRRQQYGFEFQNGIVDYLIESFYKRRNRSFRFCHVDDILNQARDFCLFHEVPLTLNRDVAEMALLNYFSGTN